MTAVIGTDFKGICKSNYHIPRMTAVIGTDFKGRYKSNYHMLG